MMKNALCYRIGHAEPYSLIVIDRLELFRKRNALFLLNTIEFVSSMKALLSRRLSLDLRRTHQ